MVFTVFVAVVVIFVVKTMVNILFLPGLFNEKWLIKMHIKVEVI